MLNDTKKSENYVLIIDKYNYLRLEELLELAIKQKFKRVYIQLTDDKLNLISFSTIKPHIEKSINNYKWRISIHLVNVPFCLFLKHYGRIVLKGKHPLNMKSGHCFLCRYNKLCRGVSNSYAEAFGSKELESQLSLPHEVMIEIETNCNFKCQFCFNKISFAKDGRTIANRLTTNCLKKIIKKIKDVGVKSIKFTGGEPLLRNDLLEILKYTKEVGIDHVRLNTNAFLIDKDLAVSLTRYVDSFLIPLESSNPEREDILAGRLDVLSKKIRALHLLREAGAKHICVGTVITNELAEELEEVEKIINLCHADSWELFRPIPSDKNARTINFEHIKDFLRKFIPMAKNHSHSYVIANALPFCVFDKPDEVNLISYGAHFDDGHVRFAVDPRGFAKPHYFINENIGDPLDPMACWHHPFMKKMRNLRFVPDSCGKCLYVGKCRGGSRASAKIIHGSYYAPDPILEKTMPVVGL